MGIQQQFAVRARGDAGYGLTERELEVLELAGRGLSKKGIAQSLGISTGTVKWHMANSYHKLGAGSREEALRKARAGMLIESAFVCPVCSCEMHTRRLSLAA